MNQVVIFKDAYGYHTTTLENYNAVIQDANKIQTWKSAPNAKILYETLYEFYPDYEYIDMTGEL